MRDEQPLDAYAESQAEGFRATAKVEGLKTRLLEDAKREANEVVLGAIIAPLVFFHTAQRDNLALRFWSQVCTTMHQAVANHVDRLAFRFYRPKYKMSILPFPSPSYT
eukprot:gene30673-35693_t